MKAGHPPAGNIANCFRGNVVRNNMNYNFYDPPVLEIEGHYAQPCAVVFPYNYLLVCYAINVNSTFSVRTLYSVVSSFKIIGTSRNICVHIGFYFESEIGCRPVFFHPSLSAASIGPNSPSNGLTQNFEGRYKRMFAIDRRRLHVHYLCLQPNSLCRHIKRLKYFLRNILWSTRSGSVFGSVLFKMCSIG